MNNERRKVLQAAINLVVDAGALVNDVAESEQEARDNLPDSLQDSDRANLMDETIGELEDLVAELESIQERLEAAKYPE